MHACFYGRSKKYKSSPEIIVVFFSAGDVDNFIVDATTGVIRFKEDATPAKVYHVDLYATDYNGNKTPYPVVCEITVRKMKKKSMISYF